MDGWVIQRKGGAGVPCRVNSRHFSQWSLLDVGFNFFVGGKMLGDKEALMLKGCC